MSTFPKNVTTGAALLDEKVPGWETLIDVASLDLGSSCNCVVGQIAAKKRWSRGDSWLHYEKGLAKIGVPEEHASRFGFTLYGRQRYVNLTDAWQRLIERRRTTSDRAQAVAPKTDSSGGVSGVNET